MSEAARVLTGGDIDTLHFIAEGVSALTGFDLAAVSLVEEEDLRIVAVVGSPAASAELMQVQAPVSAVLDELARADARGRIRWLPHERATAGLEGFEWVPDMTPDDDPAAWHPRDLLCALLHDGEGLLLGLLSVDLPHDGRRPGLSQLDALALYAERAERTILALLGRHDLARDLALEQQVSASRAELLDFVAHELSGPTTVISARAELALETGDPAVREHLEAIDRAARRMNALTGDLLTLARAGAPDGTAPDGVVDLACVVRAALDVIPVDNGVAVVVDLPGEPVLVIGDLEELTTAASNLISNAVKYSDRGSTVRASVTRGDSHAVLVVADEGIGMSEEDVARVFDEFFRSDSDRTRERPGTGLGMAIVDRIVRRHRGHIAVSSVLGEGTTVRLALARHATPQDRADLG